MKLLAALVLLLSLCAPAVAGQGYLAVPIDDPGLSALQAMDNFSDRTYVVLGQGQWQGRTCYLVYAMASGQDLSAWDVTARYFLAARRADLPGEIVAQFTDAEGAPRWVEFAGVQP